MRLWGHYEWVRVVGVVGDVHHDGPDRAYGQLYPPYSAEYLTSKSYVVRWQPGRPAHPDALRQAVFAVDRQPVREARSMEDWVADATAAPRFQTRVMGVGGALRHRTRRGGACSACWPGWWGRAPVSWPCAWRWGLPGGACWRSCFGGPERSWPWDSRVAP